MQKKSAIIALLAWLLIFPILAQAAPVGKFTAVDGNVDVTPPGKEAVPANLGDQLNAGDIIRTKSKSKCEVTFLDGSVLRLAENSRLRVSEFSQDEGKRSATLDLFRGKIQNVVKTVAGATGDRSKYEVRTPTAVCGVRGTQFYNYYQAGVSGAVVTEGKVYAYSTNNPTEVRTVNAGQAMVVTDPNVAPTVRTATAVETEQHQKDTTPADKPKSDARKEEEQKTKTAAAPTGSSPQGGGTPSSASKPEEQLPAATLATLPTLAALSENILTTSAPTVQPPPTTPIVPPTAVNKTPPQVTLTTTPPEKTNNAEATFIVASAETAVTYQYSLDGGAVTPAASTTIALPALPDGTHTLAVTAIDPTGNVSEPATYSWTIDTTKPTITLSGTPTGSTNATSATIGVSTSEPTTFAYTLNGAPVASPNLADLPQGANTFTVTAADAAGNTSTKSYTWTVDTTKPVITLSGVPTGLNNATSTTISVSANKPVTYSYSLNGTPVTSPNLTTLPEGSNTFTVTATDSAGNVSTASYTWTSDYRAPAITLSGTPASDVTRANSLNIDVSANESVTYAYSLNGTPVTYPNLTELREGSNTFAVTATDAAGNTSTKTYTWLTDYSWTPTFTGGINEVAATPENGPLGFGYWDFNNSQFVTVPAQYNQPSFRGSLTGGRIYDTLRQEYVGDSLFKGTPPAIGSTYPAASFLAEGTYDTATAGRLFAAKIMGGGPDFTVAGDGNGFIAAVYGGVRTGDYLSGGVAGIYVRPEGNNTYEAGWLTSLTVDASLDAATGTWQTTGSNLLTATRMSSGLNGPLTVEKHGMNVAQIAGGGILGTAVLTPYGLANAGNPMESVTNWGIWTMAAGGTLSSPAPASSWQTLTGWQEANGEGGTSYGLIRLDGTAGTGQMSGLASGWLLSPEHVVTINGSFAGAYPAGQPPADETGTWEGIGMGTFVETATDFGGNWNHSTLYNDFGWLAWNSSEEGGVFGFQKRPDGKYDFLAIGQFYDYGYGREGFGGPYLWSGALYNDNQMPNKHLEAFTGGLWQKANSGDPSGALAGHTAALYYGDGQVGLIKGDLTGTFYEMQDYDYERSGMWQAASGAGGLTSIDKTPSLPEGFDVSTAGIGSDSLYAYAAGSFVSGTGENVGTLRGEYYNGKTKFITYYDAGYEYYEYEYRSLPFGIYNLKLGEGAGYNYYTGKPAGAAVSWNAKIGRDGYFGYDYGNQGYWLADISGTWNEYQAGAGHGTINGTLSGQYVTSTHMGTIGGPLYGLYTEGGEIAGDGTWIGLSVGAYEGTATDFGGEWDNSTLYNAQGYMSWNSEGNDYGYFGFKKRPDEKYDFLAIGEFSDFGYGGFDRPQIWSGSLWYEGQTGNRYLEGFTGGLRQKTDTNNTYGTLHGYTTALYYGDGQVGLIKGALTGAFYEMQDYDYEKLGLWQAASGAGGLTSIEKTASLPQGFDVSTAYIDSNSLYAYAAGSFVSGTGENVGTLRGEDYNGKTKFITYYDAGYEYYEYKSLPFGIYNLKLGEGSDYNYYTGKPAGAAVPWNAKIGSDGYFGYDYGNQGYWLANISGTWNEYQAGAGHGTINGTLSGQYVTSTHMGTIGGPLYGLYTEDGEIAGDGTWIGLSVGAYEGSPLVLSGRIAGSIAGTPIFAGLIGGTSSSLGGNTTTFSSLLAMGQIVVNGYDGSPYGGYSAVAGGTADFASGQGYWLANSSGQWDSAGSFAGTLTGQYLSPTEWGTISTEAFTGTYYGSMGMWKANEFALQTSPQDLAFASWFELAELGWGGSWTNTGLYALLGGTTSIWGGADNPVGVDITNVHLLGAYNGASGLWAQRAGTSVTSHNFKNDTGSTYDGGSYDGYLAVTIDDTNAAKTDLIARYVAPDEGRGFLKGTLNGTAYPALGLFDGDGSVKRIPLTDPAGDWGIWQAWLNNGNVGTTGAPPSSFEWLEEIPESKTWWGSSYDVQNVSAATATTSWTGNLAAARADWVSATTGVIGGHVTGLYDPNASAWKAIAQGAYIGTSKFLAMAADQAGRNTLAALNIPYIQVGQASLSGSGNNLTVDMNNVTFFANSVGTAPRIWATNGVSGTYTAPPLIQGQTGYQAVPLSSGGGWLQANFEVRNWNTAAGTWGANITGGNGTLSGGGYNGAVNFSGGAAGNIGAGTISGTAAGIVKP